MKRLSKYFLRGLLTFLPFGLTVYIFFLFIIWSERLTSRAVTWIFQDVYIPGTGLAIGVGAIVFLGFIVSQPIFNRFVDFVELPFKNVPLIRSIYMALKSLSDYFSPGAESGVRQVVVVKFPNLEMEIVGFLTRSKFSDLPAELQGKDRVAVYLPLSYQVGGYTVFIPKDWVRPLDMPVEEAMRSSLIAWMPGRKINGED